MARKPVLICIAAALLTTSACATVTRGTSDQVMFTSNPSGIRVSTSMNVSCVTPCSLRIKRAKSFNASFEHGKQKRVVRVDVRSLGEGTAATAGNIIAGGLIGVAVDAGTGATLDHVPNPVHVDFSVPQSQIQASALSYYQAYRKAENEKNTELRKQQDAEEDVKQR